MRIPRRSQYKTDFQNQFTCSTSGGQISDLRGSLNSSSFSVSIFRGGPLLVSEISQYFGTPNPRFERFRLRNASKVLNFFFAPAAGYFFQSPKILNISWGVIISLRNPPTFPGGSLLRGGSLLFYGWDTIRAWGFFASVHFALLKIRQ